MASGQTTSAGSRVQAKLDDSGDVEEGAGLLLSVADEDDAGGPRGCCSLLIGRAMVLLLCDEACGHKGARDGTRAAMDVLATEVWWMRARVSPAYICLYILATNICILFVAAFVSCIVIGCGVLTYFGIGLDSS